MRFKPWMPASQSKASRTMEYTTPTCVGGSNQLIKAPWCGVTDQRLMARVTGTKPAFVAPEPEQEQQLQKAAARALS